MERREEPINHSQRARNWRRAQGMKKTKKIRVEYSIRVRKIRVRCTQLIRGPQGNVKSKRLPKWNPTLNSLRWKMLKRKRPGKNSSRANKQFLLSLILKRFRLAIPNLSTITRYISQTVSLREVQCFITLSRSNSRRQRLRATINQPGFKKAQVCLGNVMETPPQVNRMGKSVPKITSLISNRCCLTTNSNNTFKLLASNRWCIPTYIRLITTIHNYLAPSDSFSIHLMDMELHSLEATFSTHPMYISFMRGWLHLA
jgi:hypothetical protein